MKTKQSLLKVGWRELDNLKSRLAYQLVDDRDRELIKSDMLLKDYVWSSESLRNSENRIDIYNKNNAHTEIPNEKKLRLLYSYTGDAALTNQAEIVLICRSK